MLSLLHLGVKAQQYFVSSSCTFLDEKTLLKIWLNPGLNLTIFRGTLVERRRLPRFPAKMTLVHARALLSILRANYYPVDTYVTGIRHAMQWIMIYSAVGGSTPSEKGEGPVIQTLR